MFPNIIKLESDTFVFPCRRSIMLLSMDCNIVEMYIERERECLLEVLLLLYASPSGKRGFVSVWLTASHLNGNHAVDLSVFAKKMS